MVETLWLSFCSFESSVQARTLELDIHVSSRLDPGVRIEFRKFVSTLKGWGIYFCVLRCSYWLLYGNCLYYFLIIALHFTLTSFLRSHGLLAACVFCSAFCWSLTFIISFKTSEHLLFAFSCFVLNAFFIVLLFHLMFGKMWQSILFQIIALSFSFKGSQFCP